MPSSCSTPRRCFVRDGLFWAKSSFNREILTLEHGEALVRSCKTSGITIPVAASVTELSLEISDWLEDCKRMELAGADAIQLDFFYVENMLSELSFESRFVKLLCIIRENIRIPIMPKLNIALPAGYAAHLLKQGGIKYVSLLDSIKTPPPVFIDWQDKASGQLPSISFERSLNGGGLSVFGSCMLPITAQYTNTLAEAGFEVCAGGGVTNGGSAVNLLMLGASSVQVATDVLLNGYRRFADLNEEINLIDNHIVSAHFQGRCGDLRLFHELGDRNRQVKNANHHAELYSDRCDPTLCGQECKRQAFCSSISIKESKPFFSGCEGCALCASLCPRNSIRMAASC
jgi:dihydroorotate dehydrogenase